jgi:hypothetical protein
MVKVGSQDLLSGVIEMINEPAHVENEFSNLRHYKSTKSYYYYSLTHFTVHVVVQAEKGCRSLLHLTV